MPELFALSVGVIALIVSVWSAVSSRRIASRQNDLQERLLALETSRERDRLRHAQSAQVRASIVKMGRGDYRLVVSNEGPVTARDVKVLLDGKPLLEHELVIGGQTEVTKLGPGTEASYILAVAQQSPDVVDVQITWDDDSGPGRSWESQLKVF